MDAGSSRLGRLLVITAFRLPDEASARGVDRTGGLIRRVSSRFATTYILAVNQVGEERLRLPLLRRLRPLKVVRYGSMIVIAPPTIFMPRFLYFQRILSTMTGFIVLIYMVLGGRIKFDAMYLGAMRHIGFFGMLLKRIVRKPLIAEAGDPMIVRRKGLPKLIDRVFERLAFSLKPDAVLYFDPVLGQHYRQHYSYTNLVFFPSGYSPQLLEPPDPVKIESIRQRHNLLGRRIVLYGGQIELSQYRLDLLIEAAPEIIRKVPNIIFLMIGGGSSVGKLRSMVQAKGLQEYFKFIGLIPHRDMAIWISIADICININNDTPLGAKTYDAMALKKPVLSAAPWYNRYKQFLFDGENCLLVPLDSERIAEGIVRLLIDSELAEKIRLNGYETVKSYTWDALADTLVKLIKKPHHGCK